MVLKIKYSLSYAKWQRSLPQKLMKAKIVYFWLVYVQCKDNTCINTRLFTWHCLWKCVCFYASFYWNKTGQQSLTTCLIGIVCWQAGGRFQNNLKLWKWNTKNPSWCLTDTSLRRNIAVLCPGVIDKYDLDLDWEDFPVTWIWRAPTAIQPKNWIKMGSRVKI